MDFKFELPNNLDDMKKKLNDLRKMVYSVRNEKDLESYIKKIENYSMSDEVKRLLVQNFGDHRNIFFRIPDLETPRRLLRVLKNSEIENKSIEHAIKLKMYLYLYTEENNEEVLEVLNSYGEKIGKEDFYKYITKNSKQIFEMKDSTIGVTSKFPVVFKRDYPLIEWTLEQAEKKSEIHLFEEWVLRLWGTKKDLNEFTPERKKILMSFLPKNLVSMLKSNNIEIEKIEKVRDSVFIKVSRNRVKKNYIQIQKNKKNLTYELLSEDEYKKTIEYKISKYSTKSLFSLRRSMVKIGYKFKIEEFLKLIFKIIKWTIGIALGIFIIFIIFVKLKNSTIFN